MSASARNCCVPNCSKTRSDDIILHTFPDPIKENERFVTWVNAVGTSISSLNHKFLFKNRKICHSHFENKYKTWSRRLSNVAVPTLHMPVPSASGKTESIATSMMLDNEYDNTVIESKCNGKGLEVEPMAGFKEASKHIVWVDLEMTGLDIDTDKIMEIACLITDANLNVIATGPDIIIHQPDEILKNMVPWCVNQHGESGLTQASRNSTVTVAEAENTVLDFLKNHIPKGRCPLGGNTVWMDRLFIRKYMPTLNDYLHYRIIDVSSIKELAKRWFYKEYNNMPKKRYSHRALEDILDTVAELKHYKDSIFKT